MGATQSSYALQKLFVRISSEIVSPDDKQAWDLAILHDYKPEEIFSQISADDVRRLKQFFPSNFVTLITKVSQVVIHFGNEGVSGEYEKMQLVTALGILLRLLPFAFEDPEEHFSDRIYWRYPSEPVRAVESTTASASTPIAESASIAESSAQNSSGDQEGADEVTDSNIDMSVASEENVETESPLGAKLLDALAQLFFHSNFSLSWEDKVTSNIVWFSVSYYDEESDDDPYLSNRQLLLRTLITLFSDQIYSNLPISGDGDGDSIPPNPSPWLLYFTTRVVNRSAEILESLLNTLLRYDPFGWGIPYSSYIVSDHHEPLLHATLQLLSILLDYQVPTQTINLPSPTKAIFDQPAPSVTENVYITMFREIKEPVHYSMLLECLTELLESPIKAASTYLPNSAKGVTCHQEILYFMWKVMEVNKGFSSHIAENENIAKFTAYACYYICQYRRQPAYYDLVSYCLYILIHLSSSRDFCVRLNEPFQGLAHPDLPIFYGNHADLLVMTTHKFLTDSPKVFIPLHESFLTLMANASPYVKSYCATSVAKLFSLFTIFASPKFIYAKETNHIYINYFLETINNILQYQSSGNSNIIQSILRNAELFRQLARVPLSAPSQARPRQVEDSVRQTSQLEPESDGLDSSTSFVPTLDWIEEWKQKLPIHLVLRLLDTLGPVIDEITKQSRETSVEDPVLQYLEEHTIVGILPVPHPITVRRYQPNSSSQRWFTVSLWRLVYRNNLYPPIFKETVAKAFAA